MGQPIDEAYVEIKPETGSFESELLSSIDATLARLEQAVQHSTSLLEQQFAASAQGAGQALEGMAGSADQALSAVESEAAAAGESLGAEIADGAEVADLALDQAAAAGADALAEVGDAAGEAGAAVADEIGDGAEQAGAALSSEVTGGAEEAAAALEEIGDAGAAALDEAASAAADAGDEIGSQIDAGAADAAESLDGLGDSGSLMGRTIATAAGVAVGGLLGIATTATGEAAAAMVGAANSAAGYGDSLDKTSARIGVTVEHLQDMQFWASQNGIAGARLNTMMERFSRTVGEAAAETGVARDAFEALGVSVTNSEGDLRSNEAVMRDTIAALENIDEPSAQAAAAYDIFGRASLELLPALREGALTFDDASAAMDEMGRVSQRQVDLAVVFTDQWDQITTTMRAFLADAAQPVMEFFANGLFPILNDTVLPAIGRVIDAFSNRGLGGAFEELQNVFAGGDLLGTLSETFGAMLSFVQDHILDIVNFLLDSREAFFAAALDVFGTIAEALPDIIPRVVEAILSMVTSLVDTLVQAVPFVLDGAIQLINGLIDGILASLPAVLDAAVQIITTILTTVVEALPDLITAGIELLTGIVNGIVQTIPQLQVAILQLLPTVITAVLQILPQIMTLGIQLLLALLDGFIQALPDIITAVETDLIPAFLNAIQTQLPLVLEQGVEFLTEFVTGIAETIDSIATVVSEEVVPAFTAMLEENPEIYDAALDVMNTLIESFVDNQALVSDFITNTLIPLMVKIFNENLPAIIQVGITLLVAVVRGLSEASPQITDIIVREIIPLMINGVLRGVPQMASAGSQLIRSLVSSIWSTWTSRQNLDRIRDRITGFFRGARNWLVTAGRNIINGLIDGIRSQIGRIADAMADAAQTVRDYWPFSPARTGPLSGSGDPTRAGEHIATMIADGMRSGASELRAAAGALAAASAPDPAQAAAARLAGLTTPTGDQAAVTFGPGAVVVQFQGALPTEEQARRVGEQVGLGVAEVLARRDTRLMVRAM